MAATRSLNVLVAMDSKGVEKGRKEAEKEFEKVEKAGDKLGASLRTSVGKAGTSIGGSLRTGFKGLGAVGAVAGLAVGAALSKGIVSALDIREANNKLQVQLGLTEKQSARMGKIAGKVYASNYGDSLGEVNTALKNVVTDIDGLGKASSARLQGITGDVISVSKAFDQDLGGVTRAVGQLLRTGLAKDAQSALDIVTAGFQGGADKSQDFLDTLNEYGTQFRKLGLSGKTATGLISQGLKAGARDGDIVADSLKEFSIRALDGSETTKKGFADLGLNADKMAEKIGKGGKSAALGLDQTLDRLRNIKDPVERSQTAIALFGTQAEDLGDALFALDPSNAVKGLGDVAGAARKANEQLGEGPKAKFEAFKRGLEQKFQAGITVAIEKIPAIITAVSGTISSAWAKIKETFTGGDKSASGSVKRIADNVQGFVKVVIDGVTQLSNKVSAVFSDSGIGHNLSIIGRAYLQLQGVASGVMLFIAKRIIPILVGVIEGLATTIKGVVAIIAGVLSGDFTKVWEGVKTVVRGAVKAIVAIVEGLAGLLWEGAKLAGRTVGKGILDGLKSLGHLLWEKVKAAFSFLTDGERVVTTARSVGTTIVKGILSGLGSLGHLLLDKIKGALSFAADNLPGPAGVLGKVIGAATGDGVGKLASAAGSALPSGTFGGGLKGARPSLGPFAAAASRFGLGVSSGKRPGSITSSGNVSYHSTGEAIDLAGNPAGMLGFFRQAKAKWGGRLAELIHTPGGAGIKNGKPYTYGGQVAADHYDHVHLAFDSGAPGVGDGLGNGPARPMSFNSVAAIAEGVGLPGVTFAQLAQGESGLDPDNVGHDPGGTLGLGLWQITTGFNDDIIKKYGGRTAMFDPRKNALAARDIWRKQGKGAWYGTGFVKDWNLHYKGAAAKPKTKSKSKSAGSTGSTGSTYSSAKDAPDSPTYAGQGTDDPFGTTASGGGLLGRVTAARTPGKGGPSKGFPPGFTPTEPADAPVPPGTADYIAAAIAEAALTPGTADDIAAAIENRSYAGGQLELARRSGDPRLIAEAAQNFKSTIDAVESLTAAVTEANRIQEQRDALNQQIADNQLKILALVNQGPQIVAAVVAAVSGGIGGQIGLGMQTPSYAGGVARYGVGGL